jgi:hypothetical protein
MITTCFIFWRAKSRSFVAVRAGLVGVSEGMGKTSVDSKVGVGKTGVGGMVTVGFERVGVGWTDVTWTGVGDNGVVEVQAESKRTMHIKNKRPSFLIFSSKNRNMYK